MATPNSNTRPTQTTLPSNIKPLVTALAACFAMATAPAFAAIYTVTNTNDSGAGSLRNAITSANNDATADTIEFAIALNGQTITLTSGQINITDTAGLIIDASALAGGITLSGNNASRIFGIQSQAPTRLDNLTITQGRTTADTTTTTPDCTDLATFNNGGAICAEGDLVLADSTVSGNSTAGSHAGGGGFWAGGLALLHISIVSNNSTAGSYARGGGFYAKGDAFLNNSTVSNNSTLGSGAYGGGFFAKGDTTLKYSTVSGNSTAGSFATGGGFYAEVDATLNNSTVSGNSTAGNGATGGGFYAYADTTLNNSTVSGNSTAGNGATGGGFFAIGATTLNNSTISQNQAQHATATGDGVFVSSPAATLTLNSTILSGNGTDNFASNNSPTINASHSLFGDAVAEINGTNTNNLFNNMPALGGLADNGCAAMAGAAATAACVHTHGLLASSPALDVGAANGETTDQRGTGFPRIVGVQADIGAFEGQVAASIPGDCTGDGAINISDVVCTINIVLGGGVAVNGADCNASGGAVDISDVICTINEVLNP